MKVKLAIYYIIVISSSIIFAMIFPTYLRINIVSALPLLFALVCILDVAKLGKKLDIRSKLLLMKYSRRSKDPTDTDGEFSYDKKKFDSLYEGQNENDKKLFKFATIAEMLVTPLFIVPLLFFGPITKLIMSCAIFYLIPAVYGFLSRKLRKEMKNAEKERELAIEKELEEQKKREELGKWK